MEENGITLKVTTKDKADIRKELSVALTNADMPVLSMKKIEKSLEDIFLQLTETSGEEESDDSDL